MSVPCKAQPDTIVPGRAGLWNSVPQDAVQTADTNGFRRKLGKSRKNDPVNTVV